MKTNPEGNYCRKILNAKIEGNKKSACDKIKLNKKNFARGETLRVDVIAAARILAGIFC